MTDDTRNKHGDDVPEAITPPDLGEAMVTPSQDTIFSLLGDDHRRQVCHYLSTATENVHSLTELAEAVAPAVDCDPGRLAIELHHHHLPKFDRAGLLDYDPRSRTIRYRGQPCIEKWTAEARMLADR